MVQIFNAVNMAIEGPVGSATTMIIHLHARFQTLDWPFHYSHEMREKIKKTRNFITNKYSPGILTGWAGNRFSPS